ncbi:PilZ domain-containing protein [Methylobacterium terricola]|uniref:PilZ domain-containing protein n=1 Tax=Methylobacterium terricola TaxID=2583531 RepID=A0A5C4LN93_9HYPH|nr:PilZ domain-containing protein [Methylobacterium terricola]TNC15710.1 PilZ domain-containing protein [Methylobacterium terricola]
MNAMLHTPQIGSASPASAALAAGARSDAARDGAERRRDRRFPVTLSARLRHGGRSYRTEILNLSRGGLLLAPVTTAPLLPGASIRIEAASIGEVEARVVSLSALGIHVRVDDTSERFQNALVRLARLTRIWTAPGA